jgi:hypothetical protein
MKLKILVLLIIFHCLNFIAFCDDEISQEKKSITIGFNVGEQILLAPNTLTNSAETYIDNVEQSLTNGLSGIGYGTTFCGSFYLMFNIYPKENFNNVRIREIPKTKIKESESLPFEAPQSISSGEVSTEKPNPEVKIVIDTIKTVTFGEMGKKGLFQFYVGSTITSWKSTNLLKASDSLFFTSENKLSMIQFSIGTRYFYSNDFYIAPELNFSLLDVAVMEDSYRGNIDFKKAYMRLGAGFSLGTIISISNNFEMDVNFKANFPNLYLSKEDDPATYDSEALVKSLYGTKEQLINSISLNIGIFYSFF